MWAHVWGFWSAVGFLVVAFGLIWVVVALSRSRRFAQARRDFHHQRERLEVKFVQLGLINTKSHTPRWTDCTFDDDVSYARSRSTGELSAFVAVTIEMEGIDDILPRGGDAIGNLRAATAVFRFDGDRWETDGRAIFNLTPAEAIHFYQRDLEMVGQEVAARP